jgi:hypothetical protein
VLLWPVFSFSGGCACSRIQSRDAEKTKDNKTSAATMRTPKDAAMSLLLGSRLPREAVLR